MYYREYIITEEYPKKTVVHAICDEQGRDLEAIKTEYGSPDADSVTVEVDTQAIRPFTPRSTQTFDKLAE